MSSELRERIAAVPFWYHSIELAPGVVTPGFFDHRSIAAQIPFPAIEGKRCLDVGTYDGFWAFEMERRGAAEVVAADVLDPARWDWPPGSEDAVVAEMEGRKEGNRGFDLAREALGSKVDLIDRSIYELDPDRDGHFDVVYVGSLLLHLRDPVGALMSVRGVCSGHLVLNDAVTRLGGPPVAALDGVGRPWWWKPNTAGLARFAKAAGFEVIDGPKRIGLPFGSGGPGRPGLRDVARSREARDIMLARARGDAHATLLARPLPNGGRTPP